METYTHERHFASCAREDAPIIDQEIRIAPIKFLEGTLGIPQGFLKDFPACGLSQVWAEFGQNLDQTLMNFGQIWG